MEDIIFKLLASNNKKTMRKRRKDLNEALMKSNGIFDLCDLGNKSKNLQIREMAINVLRQKLGKRNEWNNLNSDDKNRIKEKAMQMLINEKEMTVKTIIAKFVGDIGKFEFPDNTWPKLLPYIATLCNSDNNFDKEVCVSIFVQDFNFLHYIKFQLGISILSTITETPHCSFLVYAELLTTIFQNILDKLERAHSNLAYSTVTTMTNLVVVIATNEQMLHLYESLLPRILEIIKSFSEANDDKKTCHLFEILEELIEFAVGAVIPNAVLVLDICLDIAATKSFCKPIKVKAMSVICRLIKSKEKTSRNIELIESILHALTEFIGRNINQDIKEDSFLKNSEEFSVGSITTYILDLITLHWPADVVVPYFLEKIHPTNQNNGLQSKKAAFLSLTTLVEGYSEEIQCTHIEDLIQNISYVIDDDKQEALQNVVIYSLMQLTDHLEPKINRYAHKLLPIIFNFLNKNLQVIEAFQNDPMYFDTKQNHLRCIENMFNILDLFCQSLDTKITVYLPTLMNQLFTILNSNEFSLQLKNAALVTLGSTVTAAKNDVLSYLQKIMNVLFIYINDGSLAKSNNLQCSAIETLAAVAKFVGPENFKAFTNKTIKLSLQLLQQNRDPHAKKSLYVLLASLSFVTREEFVSTLKEVHHIILQSIERENIFSDFNYSENDELDSDKDSTNIREKELEKNSKNLEKLEACIAIKEICINTGAAFRPFIESSYKVISELVSCPPVANKDIRKAAVDVLLQFCLTLFKEHDSTWRANEILDDLVLNCYNEITAISMNQDRSVVIHYLEIYSTLLEELKSELFVNNNVADPFVYSVIEVITFQTYWQRYEEYKKRDTDIDEDELDEPLLEAAGEVAFQFVSAYSSEYLPYYFKKLLKPMISKTKPYNSIVKRSFGYRTIARCMKPLGVNVADDEYQYFDKLLNFWFTGGKDPSEEVRNNAIFGLGEMILYGKEKVFCKYCEILQFLINAIGKETNDRTLDNISAAIAKMILANSTAVPLDQVFPILLEKLPLREDFEENQAIIDCIFKLHQDDNPILKQNLQKVIRILNHMYHNQQIINNESNAIVMKFLQIHEKTLETAF